MNRAQHRRGMLLIVIVGLAAILLSLSVGFLARMRADARESEFVVSEAQARIMLHAAMNYIQETSRLGWHDPDATLYPGIMRETFGWTDVRGRVAKLDNDGGAPSNAANYPLDAGPIDQFGRRTWNEAGPGEDPVWPAPGASVRCPMEVHTRPPFAIEDRLSPNPFGPVEQSNPSQPKDPLNERREQTVSYTMPAPPVRPVATTWADFEAGDALPLPSSTGLAWFRIYRETEAQHQADHATIDLRGHHGVFVVTCGAGGSLGFRDWGEVVATYPSTADRPFDQLTFEQLRAQERLLWYRLEWTAAVLPGNHSSNSESGDLNAGEPDVRIHGLFHQSDDSDDWGDDGAYAEESEVGAVRMRVGIASAENDNPLEGGSVSRNPVGTIQWIMRLESEPPEW